MNKDMMRMPETAGEPVCDDEQTAGRFSSLCRAGRWLPIVAVVCVLMMAACSRLRPQVTKPDHCVVVIHSWDSVGEEKELFSECMAQAFERHGVSVEVHHIYAKMVRRPGNVFGAFDWPRYADSIRKWDPEVILLNDDPIMDWVLTDDPGMPEAAKAMKDSIFTNTPVVFAGVNTLLRDSLYKYPLMTGFEAHIDLGRNIEMFMRVTHRQHLVIELDYDDIDERLRQQFAEELRDSTRFIDDTGCKLAFVSTEWLQNAYPGIAVLNFVSCGLPYRNGGDDLPDAESKAVTARFYQEAPKTWHMQVKRDIFSNSLIDHSKRPQFTCIREQFNNPKEVLFLGGYFTSTETQVEDQVLYASRILRGERPKSLPISLHASDYYMDWNAMQMVYPKMPYSYYSQYFKIVNVPFHLEDPLLFSLGIGGILLVAGGIIFLIVISMSRWRQKAQLHFVEEQQHEEHIYDLVFSDAKDTIWKYSDEVFVFSSKFAEHFALPSNTMTLKEMASAVHPDTKAAFDFLMDFRNQLGKKTVRLRLSPDGEHWYWAEATYTATEETARSGELYGLLLNIDQKKQMEEQLEQAQILASQVALKENFLANISHDLRTPLGAVTGFSTLLTTPGMVFEPGERESYGEIIHQNTDMILSMIDSVMEKAQIETGDLEIIQKPVSVQKLVDECYNTNRIIAPTHLKFNLETDTPDATVNIDVTRTKQVVNNFLSNAFKFTTVGSITLGWHYLDDRKQVEVYVKDTGIGISEEKQASVFERYNKVNETDKGTGLGLNISKTIIEKQGGTIGVESHPGQGSKFYFRLSKMVKSLVLLFALAMGLLNTSCLQRRHAPEVYANVLVIHGGSKDFSGYKAFNEDLSQTFWKEGVATSIKHAYLNVDATSGKLSAVPLMNADSMRTMDWTPDIILADDDDAAHTYLTYQDMGVFGDLDSVPVVLGGLRHPEWHLIRKYNHIVVISDPIDYCANINLAVEMTGKNCVEVELDFFSRDSIIRQELRQAIARPPYIDDSDFHLTDIRDEKFANEWKDSLAVLVFSVAEPENNSSNPYERDQGYRNLRNIYLHSWLYPSVSFKKDIYSPAIVDKTGKPQFTGVKEGFGEGDGRYLCGYFASYHTVAVDMATIAAQILHGTDPASLVGLTHKKQYYMDYQAMQMMGMKYDDYKDRFTIVGAPTKSTMPVLYYSMWVLIALVFVSAMISVLLILQSWRERGVQELIADVTHRAEMRQLAMHGSDSHIVHTEDGVQEIISKIHPDHASEVPLMMQALNIEGTHFYDVYADVENDGVYRWWQLRFVVLYEKLKHTKGVDGILINIDEAKQYEEDLRKALSLAEEARQKEDFLATISHEIRTPLNAVVGFSDVMVSMPPEAFTPEELAEYGKIIKANNTSLASMIEDILMFSRIESGRIQYVKEEFDAAALVREVAGEWADIIPDGVKLQTVAVQEGIMVNNDRTRIKYILNQLLSNAAKFTKQGVIIAGVSYHFNSDRVEFFVVDTGCGIPREKQEVAFGLFWKDDGFVPGLGLGLHVAKKLADGMSLQLTVESKAGFGSRFSLLGDASLTRPDAPSQS